MFLIPFVMTWGLVFWSCSDKMIAEDRMRDDHQATFRYLALGDSYTIGESVPRASNFPSQLTAVLKNQIDQPIDLEIIATTGWTTSDLKEALENIKPDTNHDLVTLLIGVNNQYQGKPFSVYETEFNQLLDLAIIYAGKNTSKVLVVSIPDYAYTPFGQSRPQSNSISEELDRYNEYAASVSKKKNVRFINITDITREGLDNSALVASDGLHPSAEAYRLFVKRLQPFVIVP